MSSVFLNSPSTRITLPFSSTSVHRRRGSSAALADCTRRLVNMEEPCSYSSCTGRSSGLSGLTPFFAPMPQSRSCHVGSRAVVVVLEAPERGSYNLVAVVDKARFDSRCVDWLGPPLARPRRHPEAHAVIEPWYGRRSATNAASDCSRRNRRRLRDGTGRRSAGCITTTERRLCSLEGYVCVVFAVVVVVVVVARSVVKDVAATGEMGCRSKILAPKFTATCSPAIGWARARGHCRKSLPTERLSGSRALGRRPNLATHLRHRRTTYLYCTCFFSGDILHFPRHASVIASHLTCQYAVDLTASPPVTMALTPISIRGKRKPAKASSNASKPLDLVPRKAQRSLASVLATQTYRSRASLESLPAEILESIFLYSASLSLPRASAVIGLKLSSKATRLRAFIWAFHDTWDQWFGIPRIMLHKPDPQREAHGACDGDPILQVTSDQGAILFLSCAKS